MPQTNRGSSTAETRERETCTTARSGSQSNETVVFRFKLTESPTLILERTVALIVPQGDAADRLYGSLKKGFRARRARKCRKAGHRCWAFLFFEL
jgi:hypothetical protein